MNQATREPAPVRYTAAAIKVLHFDAPPQTLCFRTHWHDRMEILYIRSGELEVRYGTSVFTASAGAMVIIPPKMSHTGYTRHGTVSYDVLMFDIRSFYNDTEICKSLLPALYDGRAKIKPLTFDTETARCFTEICGGEDEGSLQTTARIYRLLFLLFENNLLRLQQTEEQPVIKAITTYLEQHFNEEIDVPLLSRRFGYSAAHLCRKFKSVTGLSPMMYLHVFRLETAREKLKYTPASIGEIAAECGFPDANYFTRCFKKHFGVPPTAYRKTTTNR